MKKIEIGKMKKSYLIYTLSLLLVNFFIGEKLMAVTPKEAPLTLSGKVICLYLGHENFKKSYQGKIALTSFIKLYPKVEKFLFL